VRVNFAPIDNKDDPAIGARWRQGETGVTTCMRAASRKRHAALKRLLINLMSIVSNDAPLCLGVIVWKNQSQAVNL